VNNRIGFIYTLSCPDTELVRYVGQTVDVQKRYNLHIFHSKNGSAKTHKEKWINTLTNEGKKPLMEIVWDGNTSLLDQKETEFIALFKSFGAKLTNATMGGTTTRGRKCSEETKQKFREIFTGRKNPNYKMSEEGKKSFLEKRKNFKMPEEAKRKLSEARKGKPSFWSTNLMSADQIERLILLNKVKAKRIVAIKDGVETVYDSTQDAAKATGCDRKTMRMVARGIYKQCKGYQFKFAA
jgi:group I intron endonuclease